MHQAIVSDQLKKSFKILSTTKSCRGRLVCSFIHSFIIFATTVEKLPERIKKKGSTEPRHRQKWHINMPLLPSSRGGPLT